MWICIQTFYPSRVAILTGLNRKEVVRLTKQRDDQSTIGTPNRATPVINNSNEIVVVWQASTDDKGVRGYNIYRNLSP